MRVILLICLIAAAAVAQMPPIEPGVSHELAKWRASQYSNISYKLNLTLEKMSPVLKGTIEIRVTQAAYACAEPNCPEMPLILDWRKIAGHEDLSTISFISLNGRTLVGGTALGDEESPESTYVIGSDPKRRPNNVILYELNDHLVFRHGLVAGENVIKLDFTSPILTSGSAVTRYIDKEDGAEYIYSLFVPSDASTAFPCFDQPDLKARFHLQIRTPKSWKRNEISNAKAVSIDYTNGWATTDFEETKSISTYVFAFAVGDFGKFRQLESGQTIYYDEVIAKTFNGREVFIGDEFEERIGKLFPDSIYVRKSQAEKFKPHVAEVFRLKREGVKYLETYFDYKFPFPKYDLVLIPEFPFGGMEHAGAVFLREDRVIFPAEPTKGDYITRANLIFHETAHQWFGDTVTMRWFDDLWLKEGFAEFMAYKTLERVMPDANAWKVFYERNKQAAYLTDSTRGTTPIYQPIANLSAAKSAYGNIVYRKAPSFLRQAEFYLGEDKFQTAVRAFLKKHEFGNAGWEDLVNEFINQKSKTRGGIEKDIADFSDIWVTKRGLKTIRTSFGDNRSHLFRYQLFHSSRSEFEGSGFGGGLTRLTMEFQCLVGYEDGTRGIENVDLIWNTSSIVPIHFLKKKPVFVFPNYQDYGYGIFLLDDKSRDYVLKNIQNEKDPFLRSMMWGALWDSVREAELDPKDYVELAIKNLGGETDETISQSILSRVSTAMNYYIDAPGRDASVNERAPAGARPVKGNPGTLPNGRVSARLEAVLLDRLQHAPAAGQRITFYRAYVANATTEKGREVLKEMLRQSVPRAVATRVLKAGQKAPVATAPGTDTPAAAPLRTKDRFDIVTRLAILGDADAPKLLAELERTETSDEAKRYAYAARAAFGTAENKAKFFDDFLTNKAISESWIESAIVPFNSIRHADLTQQYLAQALTDLPNLKRTRKIFFINNWLAAFIGGQRDEKALAVVNKFLTDNPSLDNDLRLKVLENLDLIERAVKIRAKYGPK